MGIDTGHMCFDDWFWERRQPAFRFPLIRVWTPKVRVAIGTECWNNDVRSFWHQYFWYFPTVRTPHRICKGQYHILASSTQVNTDNKTRTRVKTNVRKKDILTGGNLVCLLSAIRMQCADNNLHPKCFPTYCIKVGKVDEVVIVQLAVDLRLPDLFSQLILNMRMSGEQLQDPRERWRSRVHSGKDERPGHPGLESKIMIEIFWRTKPE